ncbi:MAG: hypothetical protein MK066_08375 [Crocinitomicaceae bacterium]|nr:hypothetical protein [Crocinitomicaceae bacterium]
MNRSINILLMVVIFPTMLLTIIVGFDLPLDVLKTTGEQLQYKEEIFLGFATLLGLLVIRRSIRRWMGMRIVGKTQRFKWSQVVSKQRKMRVQTYLFLEGLVMGLVAFALYQVTEQAFAPALALLIGVVDTIIFAIVGSNNRYRVGLSSKALIVADREVTLLYFTGLRKISLHQQTIYFDYVKDLQLSFPVNCVPEESREEFFQKLEEQVDTERVFFSRKMI